ncbi:hypothetical protein SCP_0205330 [Sparassis crispa]|uniref:FAD/NAD(P)-binding domain-containing protein n=1 Tax=Sparassis crispa TaxID=139825 RepID=A0A401GAZ3_9APHY|nr:hypothetical protein SCP_0205330 [Sparassis crispa]GBE79335.1 hypothetical protein SCP_0205330 [Sparassis crispa]
MASAQTPWTGPFQLPTLDRLKAEVPASVVPLDIARRWLGDFTNALRSQPVLLGPLFLEDAFWRDLLALSWDFRSIQSSANIAKYLDAHISSSGLRSLTLCEDSLWAPVLRTPYPDLALLQLSFRFETAAGAGTGTCRLVPIESGEWKAYTIFTCLETLHGFPERIGSLRDRDMYQASWEDTRRAGLEFADGRPAVVIIGAGHCGLELAARLKAIGVRTLVVEKSPRVGDNWRNRYKSLRLHDTVWYDHLPYMPFPSTWPVYAPGAKLGNWLESYAEALDLDVWTSSRVQSANWNAEKKTWALTVRRGEAIRQLQANHLVFATGLNGSIPYSPTIPEQERFKGQVLHSSQFTSPESFRGKKVVVVGACSSAHDISRDCMNYGIDVTMFQRSSTCMVSAEAIGQLVLGMYGEGTSLEYADHVGAATPFAVTRQLHQRAFPHFAATIDKELLDGLARVGFRTNLGPDNAGIMPMVQTRAGGYYLDTGASQEIIDGKIKLKSGGTIAAFTESALRFSDGSELPADIVIFATGFSNPRDVVKDVCSPEVYAKVKPVWGLDDEGELNSVWRGSGHEGLWFALGNLSTARFWTRLLALQIKAYEEGLLKVAS